MRLACYGGHLDVARWLFEVGAAEDTRTPSNSGKTPMSLACSKDHFNVAEWLILVGAANNTTGHVDEGTLADAVQPTTTRRIISWSLRSLIDAHAVFTHLVVPATCIVRSSSTSSATVAPNIKKQRSQQTDECMLPRLLGHEETLLSLVADFVGVVRGRKLRNTREAMQYL